MVIVTRYNFVVSEKKKVNLANFTHFTQDGLPPPLPSTVTDSTHATLHCVVWLVSILLYHYVFSRLDYMNDVAKGILRIIRPCSSWGKNHN